MLVSRNRVIIDWDKNRRQASALEMLRMNVKCVQELSETYVEVNNLVL